MIEISTGHLVTLWTVMKAHLEGVNIMTTHERDVQRRLFCHFGLSDDQEQTRSGSSSGQKHAMTLQNLFFRFFIPQSADTLLFSTQRSVDCVHWQLPTELQKI